jgi:glycosyltransferase involved in cell wall biosynthesis
VSGNSRPPGRFDRKIVYVIAAYPDLTKTFIDREILEAKRLGLDLKLVAIQRPPNQAFPPEVRDLMRDTTYLRPCSIVAMARAHLRCLRNDFRTYVGTLWHLVTRSHPTFASRLKTVVHFCEGVFAAWLLRRAGIDHVHAHFADRATVIAIVISRLLRVPYSVTVHAYDIYKEPVFLLDKLRNARFATTCTAFNKAHLDRETTGEIELIYHGLDFRSFPEVVPRPSTPPLILSVGRLQKKKGFSFLVRALSQMKAAGQDFRCEIIGEGPERASLSQLIAESGLDGLVLLSGALPNAEVMGRYPCASVFVMPSRIAEDGDRDGIPNVILEAMAFGLPVVSTNVSGIPEVVHNRETGILIEPADSQALAAAITELLQDRELASRVGAKAATFVRSRFDIRRNVSRLVELLHE